MQLFWLDCPLEDKYDLWIFKIHTAASRGNWFVKQKLLARLECVIALTNQFEKPKQWWSHPPDQNPVKQVIYDIDEMEKPIIIYSCRKLKVTAQPYADSQWLLYKLISITESAMKATPLHKTAPSWHRNHITSPSLFGQINTFERHNANFKDNAT